MIGRRLFLSLFLALVVSLCTFWNVQAFSSHAFGSTRNSAVIKPTQQRFNVRPYQSTSPDLSWKQHYPTTTTTRLLASKSDDDDLLFNGKSTIALVGAQSLLIGAAAVASVILGTPNFGLGPSIEFNQEVVLQGMLCTLPLGVLAYALDLIEDGVPSLQDVSKATQRSVIALLGVSFKPGIALLTSVSLGLAAGFGEEMLFRGVLQYELASRFGPIVGVGFSSIVFGALHAVTPLYAVLASMASVYFGLLYSSSGNLAVPIVTHAIYDVGALLWAHWTVTQMTKSEREEIINWKGPADGKKGPMDGTIL